MSLAFENDSHQESWSKTNSKSHFLEWVLPTNCLSHIWEWLPPWQIVAPTLENSSPYSKLIVAQHFGNGPTSLQQIVSLTFENGSHPASSWVQHPSVSYALPLWSGSKLMPRFFLVFFKGSVFDFPGPGRTGDNKSKTFKILQNSLELWVAPIWDVTSGYALLKHQRFQSMQIFPLTLAIRSQRSNERNPFPCGEQVLLGFPWIPNLRILEYQLWRWYGINNYQWWFTQPSLRYPQVLICGICNWVMGLWRCRNLHYDGQGLKPMPILILKIYNSPNPLLLLQSWFWTNRDERGEQWDGKWNMD